VVEPRDDHGDDGDDHKMIKCFTFGKEEREKQDPKSRQRYIIGVCFR
jgi:hypothetical protein